MSIAGHVLFVSLPPEHHAQPVRSAPRELEFTLATLEPAAASEPVEFPEPEPAEKPVEKRRLDAPDARAVAAPAPAIEPPAPSVASAPPVPATVEPARSASPGSIDLSPRAAAATLTAEIEKQLASGSCSVARGSSDCSDGKLASAPKPVTRGSAARLPGSDEYQLKPTGDGGYVHKSLGFNAHIEPNGDVHFDDKTRDLNDLVSHMVGEQAYTAQKRRFLAQTAELRDQLAAEALVKNQRRGIAALAHQLQRVLADASRSALQKRIAIFALWDDCANDTLGAEAQHKIEAFVREHMPQDGALAYTADELAELNRRRVSKRQFAPYG